MDQDASPKVFSPARSLVSDGIVGGVAATIDFCSAAAVIDLTDQVHLLPCSVKHDGPCSVSDYFKPKRTDLLVDGLSVEEAFFRGKKLQGVTVPFPEGYRGYVLGKKIEKGTNSEDPDGELSHWVSRAQFGKLTYWNHDDLPSPDDPLMRCFHWFSVANALHKPVNAEEMASASSYQGRKS